MYTDRRLRGVNRVIDFDFDFDFDSFVRASGRGEAVRMRERGMCFPSLGLARESSATPRGQFSSIFCAEACGFFEVFKRFFWANLGSLLCLLWFLCGFFVVFVGFLT